jgi:serine/threonine-protein kinase
MIERTATPRVILPEISDQPLPVPCPGGYARYTEFNDLAEGGGAVLQTGIDTYLGREVVFKKLLPEFRDDEVMIRRFLREARVTALIQHPATVPVYEVGRDDENIPYFTMKKVAGHSLQEILSGIASHDPEYRAFDSREKLIDIIIQVAQAIAYAHECGVVHRDIKPANILVGDFGEVLVMDWGIAKVMGEKDENLEDPHGDLDQPADGITLKGKVYGTPRYMSPEQAKGETNIDHRTDIFSLGAVIYEALTQRPLFFGADRKEVLHQILTRRIKSPAKLEPLKLIPAPLDALCMHALEKHADDRYQTMRELVEDLEHYRRNEGVSVIEETPWQRFSQWARPRFTRTAWALLFVGGGIGWWLGKSG